MAVAAFGHNPARRAWAEVEQRSRRLAQALRSLGIALGERVGSLAWNDFRHLELFYGVSGAGVILHTINPRLAVDDIACIAGHAGDAALFVDKSFIELLEQLAPQLSGTLRHVVMLCTLAEMSLPSGV